MNPFTLKPYLGEQWFCDREDETSHMLSAIKNKRNITLHSIRRMGKTGLIMHMQSKLPKNYIPVYVDIYDTRNASEFANKLITSCLSALERKKNFLRKALNLFARFRTSVVLDPATGSPTVSLDIKDKEDIKMPLQLLWKLIKEEKKSLFQITLDEFQKISEYEESTLDATIREASQTIPNIQFIFSGSQKHLLYQLFTEPKKPLFKTSELMELHPIVRQSYSKFIQKHFLKGSKEIKESHIQQILEWTRDHTFYVQYFCHHLYEKSEPVVTDHMIQAIIRQIFLENEASYYQFKRLLTRPQWSVLSAIAHEGILQKPNSSELQKKYNLGSPSTVNRSLDSLLEKEMIYSRFNDSGLPEYQVYDVFLSRWIVNKGI